MTTSVEDTDFMPSTAHGQFTAGPDHDLLHEYLCPCKGSVHERAERLRANLRVTGDAGLRVAAHAYFESCDGACPHDKGYGLLEGKCGDIAAWLSRAALTGDTPKADRG